MTKPNKSKPPKLINKKLLKRGLVLTGVVGIGVPIILTASSCSNLTNKPINNNSNSNTNNHFNNESLKIGMSVRIHYYNWSYVPQGGFKITYVDGTISEINNVFITLDKTNIFSWSSITNIVVYKSN